MISLCLYRNSFHSMIGNTFEPMPKKRKLPFLWNNKRHVSENNKSMQRWLLLYHHIWTAHFFWASVICPEPLLRRYNKYHKHHSQLCSYLLLLGYYHNIIDTLKLLLSSLQYIDFDIITVIITGVWGGGVPGDGLLSGDGEEPAAERTAPGRLRLAHRQHRVRILYY